MIKISLPYIYNLSSALTPLHSMPDGGPVKDVFYMLIRAENTLNGFLTESLYSYHLKATYAPGMQLLSAVKKITTLPDRERILDFFDKYSVTSALESFETVLTAEMNVVNVYFVTNKRGYEMSDLVDRAQVLFPPELVEKVPSCAFDIQQAGRCIAFELGTAAGFHTMRALELVLREFYDSVMDGAARPRTNNMGDYLRELDNADRGDPKTRAALRQIKDLHRNELIHPEEILNVDDAIALLGVTQSAIIAMLKEIPPQQSSFVPLIGS